MKESLEKFGNIFMKEARDLSIENFDMIIRGEVQTEYTQKMASRMKRLSADAQNVINDMIPDIIDMCLFQTMFMFEECSDDDIKLIVDGDDLNEISDGLSGELLTSEGWIAKYSEERYHVD